MVSRFGHPADAEQRRAIAGLLERYYAAAAREDGAAACSLTYNVLARALPQDEGTRGYGPRFEQGLTTCPAILTRLFEHFHGELTAPVQVLAVRVEGDRAEILVTSKTMSVKVTEAKREGTAWKVDRFNPNPLP